MPHVNTMLLECESLRETISVGRGSIESGLEEPEDGVAGSPERTLPFQGLALIEIV